MAAILVTVIKNYIGTAAERGAFVTTGLQAGSTWKESDTGLEYNWSGAAWFVSSSETVSIAAGSSIIGKVGIDQTTDGTTNKVQARNATHDNFNANANLQVGDADVSVSNAVPVKEQGTATLVHTVATIGVASGAALAANANRKYALLINDSDAVIYLKFGGDAVLNQGIRLNANGGSYEICAANHNLDARVINAISSGASKNLLVAEG
jgi:hypothetical protein